jgi:2-polyprenyl-3-methyl-5-hydroxy-6-metoxy-1,4-benzoquinol methylase
MNEVDISQEYWDRQAQRDPLWAILSDATKREGKWDASRFFQTGSSEIASILYELEAQGFELQRGAALDFGCGVGRLTQALAPHFERVVGVDVSPRMHQLASRFNQHPSVVSYVCNQTADLRVFADHSFDFIVSNIVLQHIVPEIACSYLREFFRVLAPRGIAVFQLPSHGRRPQSRPSEAITTPLADAAYQASIVVAAPPRAVGPDEEITLQVELTNASMFDWIQRKHGVFSVGDHWLDASGIRMLTRDDGRTRLPEMLRTGQTCRLPLAIHAPAERGDYVCEIDVVHEGVLWFKDRGSPVVRLPVRVEDRAGGVAPSTPAGAQLSAAVAPVEYGAAVEANSAVDDPGEFPMYGVPLNTVVQLIEASAATLLHVENDRSCGDDWVSYRYFVRALS